MARGYPQPRHPPLLRSLTSAKTPPDNSEYYHGPSARWYRALWSWKVDDIPFYRRLATDFAGEGGTVLELAAGTGRVALPMARAGFRVTALEVSEEMLGILRQGLAGETPEAKARVETVREDMRAFQLDRLYRFIYLPFNTILMLAQPHDRYRMLERVREHLAPSGAFAFDVFTPDPRLLRNHADWEVELEHETDDPEHGRVHFLREIKREIDLGRQVIRVDFRYRVSRAGPGGSDEVLETWDDGLELALIFPRELELILERQGFRIKARYGGPAMEPYVPTLDNVQPQYVVAQLIQ